VRGEDVNFESPDVRQSGAITSSTRPGSQTDHCQRRAPDNSENPLHPWSPLSLSSALLVRKPFAIKPGNLGSAQKTPSGAISNTCLSPTTSFVYF